MGTYAIDMADAVVRRYKTHNPEEIISRAIKLKDIRYCHDLLSYYTVLLSCEYIGINQIARMLSMYLQWLMSLGTLSLTRSTPAPVQTFQDTYFYSLDNSKVKRRANTFAAELLLAGDDVLEPIGSYEYAADQKQLEEVPPSHCSTAYTYSTIYNLSLSVIYSVFTLHGT